MKWLLGIALTYWMGCTVAAAGAEGDPATMLRRARAYVNKSPARNSISGAIAAAFVRAGRSGEALEFAGGIMDPDVRMGTLRAIMLAQASVGDRDGALRTADQLDGRNKIDAIMQLAVARARAGDIEGGIRL